VSIATRRECPSLVLRQTMGHVCARRCSYVDLLEDGCRVLVARTVAVSVLVGRELGRNVTFRLRSFSFRQWLRIRHLEHDIYRSVSSQGRSTGGHFASIVFVRLPLSMPSNELERTRKRDVCRRTTTDAHVRTT
jgi:hypothetical protein